MTMSAILKVLLHRYTGQTDISIGTPLNNRTHKELEPLIGLFINNLVIRSNLSENPRFIDFLNQVKKDILDAYAYQDVPYDQIVKNLNLNRDNNRNPLFQVLLNVNEKAEVSKSDFDELSTQHLKTTSINTRLDLQVGVEESNGSCLLYTSPSPRDKRQSRMPSSA